jgi:aspartyl-tRNA(Asn)/glutamyl-tRNA(Gln) amidotransferase subunit C
MSAALDEDQVRHVARLARLKISDDEVRLFARQLTTILEHVQQLHAVKTEGVEPLAHPLPVSNVLRDDVPRASFDAPTALANAPQREGRFFRTPRILEGESGT